MNARWQTIDTAPRNESWLLLCNDDGYQWVGLWGKPDSASTPGWIRYGLKGQWTYAVPTYWTFLPSPPSHLVTAAKTGEHIPSPLDRLERQLIDAVISYVVIEKEVITEFGWPMTRDKVTDDLEAAQRNILDLGDKVLTERLKMT